MKSISGLCNLARWFWFFAGPVILTMPVLGQGLFIRQDTVTVLQQGNPLPNAWAGGLNFPLFSSVDLNGDGRKDLVAYDRVNSRLTCYTNDGSPSTNAWRYAPQYVEDFPRINRWLLMYDYNCDGKEDIFTISSQFPSCIACYRNDYTPGTGLRFTLVDDIIEETFSTQVFPVFASGVLIPALEDIDGDGDMDILGYNSIPDGRVIWHKNQSIELYGVCDSLAFSYADACWGNFALQIGGANEVGCFGCTCRGSQNPRVNEGIEPVNEPARRDDTVTSIFLIDLDGDIDKDLLIGDISALTTLMVHNGGSPAVAAMDSQDVNFPNYDIPAVFNGFHYHASLDVDNDGLKDLIVSPNEYENRNAQWVYKNTGSSTAPSYHFFGTEFLSEGMIEVGENAAPVVVDIDGDGLKDIMMAGSVYDTAASYYATSLFYFRNVGTTTAPRFSLVNEDFAGLRSFVYNSTIYPAFGDLDNDGDLDMLLGTEDGKIQLFQNNASTYQLAVPNYMGIDVGNNCTPQLVDIDRDGKLDLIAGEKNGFINFFKNTGTASSAMFANVPTEDTLGGIVLQSPGFTDGYSVPFLYDSAGVYRLAASNMAGNVYFYGNIDGNILGRYTLLDSLYDKAESNRIRFNVSVGGGDLNNDGFCDLVLGQSAGGAQLWYQDDGTVGILEPDENLSLALYPNPADRSFALQISGDKPGTALVEIWDSQGRMVRQMRSNHSTWLMDTSDLSEGIYLVRAQRGLTARTQRLIVRHD